MSTWWAAAGGQAPSAELVRAVEGLTRAQRRATRRAVRRGEAVEDAGSARLAVAIARQELRRRPSEPLLWFFALLVILWAGFAINGLATGHVVTAVFFTVTTGFGIRTLLRLRPSSYEAVRRAERLNREALQRAGEPMRDDAQAARPSVLGVAAGAVALWIFYCLAFGALSDALDGRSFDVWHAVARGALFATFMCIASLTIVRRRNDRQARNPIP